MTTLAGWSMPQPFLEHVLQANAEGCVLIVVPNKFEPPELVLAVGDRLIVDTSVVAVFSAVYAIASGDGLVLADARIDEGGRLANTAALRRDDMLPIGQVVGAVTAFR